MLLDVALARGSAESLATLALAGCLQPEIANVHSCSLRNSKRAAMDGVNKSNKVDL